MSTRKRRSRSSGYGADRINYFKVEIECLRKGAWQAFIPETCYVLKAASRRELEAAVTSHLEETLGEKYYQIIWLG